MCEICESHKNKRYPNTKFNDSLPTAMKKNTISDEQMENLILCQYIEAELESQDSLKVIYYLYTDIIAFTPENRLINTQIISRYKSPIDKCPFCGKSLEPFYLEPICKLDLCKHQQILNVRTPASVYLCKKDNNNIISTNYEYCASCPYFSHNHKNIIDYIDSLGSNIIKKKR